MTKNVKEIFIYNIMLNKLKRAEKFSLKLLYINIYM